MPVVRKVSAERSNSRSSTLAAHVTTTITTVQSATAAPNRSNNIPVGAAVGSVVGGVVLGIVVLLGWTYWWKSFRRSQQDQAVCIDDESTRVLLIRLINDQGTVLTTNGDTHRYSSLHGHLKLFSIGSPEKKQRMPHIPVDDIREKAGTYYEKTKVSDVDSVKSMHQPASPQVVFKPTHISQSRTLRKDRKRKQPVNRKPSLSPIADVDNETVDAPFEGESVDPFVDTNLPIVNVPASVSRKPSTVGSASIYSAQSGEERQCVDSPSPILGTLGPPGLDSHVIQHPISHKSSNVSSVYSSQSGEERQFGVPPNFMVVLRQEWGRLFADTNSGSLNSTS